MEGLSYFCWKPIRRGVKRILLIEDDRTFAKIVANFLQKKGYTVEAVETLRAGASLLKNQPIDLILLDYRLPDGIGLDLVAQLGNELPAVPCVIITSFNDVRTAVKSMQSGAFEYIIKPVNPDELWMVVQAALAEQTNPVPATEATVQATSPDFIRGTSEVAKRLYEHVQLVAPTEMSVMIIGESGTGKEHIARAIHDQSPRSEKPFVAVDCGVLSRELAGSELFGHAKGAFTGALTDKKGMLEKANGGTLFLDEIGNLSYEVQVKLLRTLQERIIQPIGSTKTIPVDFRLVTATNENLNEQIKAGNFREDIFHRINEFKIQMPPLRERDEDLPLFVDFFIQRANAALNRQVACVSGEVMDVFRRYDWPGNLRELQNVIKRMVLLSTQPVADAKLLPEEMVQQFQSQELGRDLKQVHEQSERALIMDALQQTKYNKSKAAQLLNIDRKTLYNKIEKYGLDA